MRLKFNKDIQKVIWGNSRWASSPNFLHRKLKPLKRASFYCGKYFNDFLLSFSWIFYIFNRLEFGVIHFTVDFLDFTDVYVVHHISSLRINKDWTTWALKYLSLHSAK